MIRAAGLTVRYDAKDSTAALENLSFAVQPGERIALMGANGAGKSTLLLCLVGIIPQAAGELAVCGLPMEKANVRELRRRVGLVFQNPEDQLFMPVVEEDIAFGPRNYGLEGEALAARIDKVLGELGISHLRNRLSHKLSGGEKRLAALAGVLVMEPSLLLLDEPSSFLDPRSRRLLIRVLQSLSQTLVIATHDSDLARSLCRRVILLRGGRLFADGPAADILDDAVLLEDCGL